MQLGMCQHPTLSYTVPGQVTNRTRWPRFPPCRLTGQSLGVLCSGWAYPLSHPDERTRKFLLCWRSARVGKQPLLPSCCLEGSDKCPLHMDRSTHQKPDPPQRHQIYSTCTHRGSPGTQDLLSMCQPSVWYMCSWDSASQLCQTCVHLLYSVQTIISPWHFPGRTSGVLQLKTQSECKIV